MDKLDWCLEQKKGIKKEKPSKNLAQSYMKRALLDYENIKNQNSVWKVVVSYYSCYHAFYSVLQAYGIKCEIHDCTITLIAMFPSIKTYLPFIETLKQNRTDTQYYLKEPGEIDVLKVKEFIDACRLELDEINQAKIENLHSEVFR
jgi:uncharacterized protein (UPF0332 family)